MAFNIVTERGKGRGGRERRERKKIGKNEKNQCTEEWTGEGKGEEEAGKEGSSGKGKLEGRRR
jgi:hypothetical protein